MRAERGSISTTVCSSANTFLPNSETRPAGKHCHIFRLARFRRHQISWKSPSVKWRLRFDSIIITEQVKSTANLPPDCSTSRARVRVRFASGAHKAVIPIVVYAGPSLVSVRVNGGETGWFFFDSGAGNLLLIDLGPKRPGLNSPARWRPEGVELDHSGMGQNVNLNCRLTPTKTVPYGLSGILPVLGRSFDGLSATCS